jgi:hypothetical protein
LIALLAVLLISGGCGKEEPIVAYSAPKEPQLLAWSLPEGWVSVPPNHDVNQYAAFVAGDGDNVARVTATPVFPDAPGGNSLLDNINRWRGQLQLPPVEPAELGSIVKNARQGDMVIQWVEMAAPAGRMRAAIVPREDRIWFYKLSGPAEAVEKHKDQFDAFVRSTKYLSPAAAALAGAEGAVAEVSVPNPHALPTPSTPQVFAPSGGGELSFTLPPGWVREAPTSKMSISKANLSTGGDKPAHVLVSQMSANFGGMAMNLSRWQKDVGLPGTGSDADLKEKPITIGSGPGLLIEFIGPGKDGVTPMRSLIARRTDGDSTWFFKILGPAETVTQQQAAFEAFLASVRLPGEAVK